MNTSKRILNSWKCKSSPLEIYSLWSREMKKLLKLLNEYAHTYADYYDDTHKEIVNTFTSHTDQCFQYHYHENWIEHFETLVDDVVISNRYWFIAWLIENKKFKNYKAYKNFWEARSFAEFSNWEVITTIEWSLYYSILSALAISENPIELLCSLLK